MSQNDSKPDLKELKRFKKVPVRRAKSELASKTERIYQDSSSAASSEQGTGIVPQDHARPRTRPYVDGSPDTSETSTTMSNVSISSSINRFRNDFDELKCKMQIFGESLSLCKCIASDFKNRLKFMEKRLQNLERREVFHRSQSNYSAIIQKNKKLSTKCLKETKVSGDDYASD